MECVFFVLIRRTMLFKNLIVFEYYRAIFYVFFRVKMIFIKMFENAFLPRPSIRLRIVSVVLKILHFDIDFDWEHTCYLERFLHDTLTHKYFQLFQGSGTRIIA